MMIFSVNNLQGDLTMEILLAIAVAAVIAALVYFNRSARSLDVNGDGKVDLADIKAAVQNTVEGVKATADVNKDGKVDAADVKMVTEKAKTQVKKAVSKAKTAVNKTSARRPSRPKTK
jgi:flagella basal body P-ring formation protein FlgA